MPNAIWAQARGAGASINLSRPPFPAWRLRGSGVELARTLPHFVHLLLLSVEPALRGGFPSAVAISVEPMY